MHIENHKDSLGKFGCNFCGENFQGKGDLMLPIRKTVSLFLQNISEGSFSFAKKCWCVHTESDIDVPLINMNATYEIGILTENLNF